MRLDDDTYIKNPINFDLRAWGEETYAWHGLIKEHNGVSKGMHSFTKEYYMKSHNSTWANPILYKATRENQKKTIMQFATNWEVRVRLIF